MGSARSPGTYRVNTFQNRNLDERKLFGSTSGVAKTGEFVGHYRGTLLKAAKKISPSFSVISSRCDAAERRYLVKAGHHIDSTSVNMSVPSSHGVALAPGTVAIYPVCLSKRVNWVWGPAPQNLTLQSWDATYHQTYSQCVSLSQRPQVLFGEVRLSHDSTWLLTMSTAAGVSGLTWPFYYYLPATGRAGILTVRQGLCPARPCHRYTTEVNL